MFTGKNDSAVKSALRFLENVVQPEMTRGNRLIVCAEWLMQLEYTRILA